MSLLITRGLGEDIVYDYVPVPVCSPEMTAHEWGKKSMKVEPSMVVVSEDE